MKPSWKSQIMPTHDFSSNDIILKLHPPIVIKSISPSRGPLNGNTKVIVHVENTHVHRDLFVDLEVSPSKQTLYQLEDIVYDLLQSFKTCEC